MFSSYSVIIDKKTIIKYKILSDSSLYYVTVKYLIMHGLTSKLPCKNFDTIYYLIIYKEYNEKCIIII